MSVSESKGAGTGVPPSRFLRSEALWDVAQDLIPGGVTSSIRAGARPHPLYFERGQGPYLWDVDGNRYVDFALGYGPLILGHAPMVVRDAISAQLGRDLTFGSQHRLEPELAGLLVATVPGAEQAIFASTGSEAVAAALRLARVATGRDLVDQVRRPLPRMVRRSVRERRFRPGEIRPVRSTVDGGGDARDPRGGPRRRRRRPMERHRLGRGDPGRASDERRSGPVRADRRERWPHLGHGRVPCGSQASGEPSTAPCSCSTRSSPGSGSPLAELRSGSGISADLAVFAKAIAGGVALSAVTGSRAVMAPIADGRLAHNGTFNGNPIAMAGGVASLRYLIDGRDRIYPELDRLGARLAAGLAEASPRLTVRSVGPIVHTAVDEPDEVRTIRDRTGDASTHGRFIEALLSRGVHATPRGLWYVSTAHHDDDIDDRDRRRGRGSS